MKLTIEIQQKDIDASHDYHTRERGGKTMAVNTPLGRAWVRTREERRDMAAKADEEWFLAGLKLPAPFAPSAVWTDEMTTYWQDWLDGKEVGPRTFIVEIGEPQPPHLLDENEVMRKNVDVVNHYRVGGRRNRHGVEQETMANLLDGSKPADNSVVETYLAGVEG